MTYATISQQTKLILEPFPCQGLHHKLRAKQLKKTGFFDAALFPENVTLISPAPI